MLDKIKTLREILKPDAIKLDIPIEEYIETYYTEKERFEILESEFKDFFIKKMPYTTHITVIEIFNYSENAEYLSKEFYVSLSSDDYKELLSKCVKDHFKTQCRINDTPILINSKLYDINWRTSQKRNYIRSPWNSDKFPKMTISMNNAKTLEENQESHTNHWDGAFKRDDIVHSAFCKIIEELHIDLTQPEYNVFILNGDNEIKIYLDTLTDFLGIDCHILVDEYSMSIRSLLYKAGKIQSETYIPESLSPNGIHNLKDRLKFLLKKETIESLIKYQGLIRHTIDARDFYDDKIYPIYHRFDYKGSNYESKKRIEQFKELKKNEKYLMFIETFNRVREIMQTENICELIKYTNINQIKHSINSFTSIYNKKGVVPWAFTTKSQESNLLKIKESVLELVDNFNKKYVTINL